MTIFYTRGLLTWLCVATAGAHLLAPPAQSQEENLPTAPTLTVRTFHNPLPLASRFPLPACCCYLLFPPFSCSRLLLSMLMIGWYLQYIWHGGRIYRSQVRPGQHASEGCAGHGCGEVGSATYRHPHWALGVFMRRCRWVPWVAASLQQLSWGGGDVCGVHSEAPPVPPPLCSPPFLPYPLGSAICRQERGKGQQIGQGRGIGQMLNLGKDWAPRPGMGGAGWKAAGWYSGTMWQHPSQRSACTYDASAHLLGALSALLAGLRLGCSAGTKAACSGRGREGGRQRRQAGARLCQRWCGAPAHCWEAGEFTKLPHTPPPFQQEKDSSGTIQQESGQKVQLL